jgi:hypothetical protein
VKKRKKDAVGSLDSLLDTMTTVVGILIILLIVVQLGADSAVKRIVDEKNYDELMEMAMRQFEDQRNGLLEEKKKLELGMAAKNKQDQQFVREIAKLEKKLSDLKASVPKSLGNSTVLQTEKKKVDDEKKKIEVKLKKIKGLLAKAPKPSSKSLSKDVHLPDPKPAPPKATPFRFLCREGKIYPLDDSSLRKSADKAIAQSGIKPNKDREYDGKKLAAHFGQKKPGNAFFSLTAIPGGDKLIRFTMERRPNVGEDELALGKSGSAYMKTLASLKPTHRYLLFEVFPDSFSTYLAAREISSKRKFPAGWKPAHRSSDWWSYYWGHHDLGRSKVPPPPKPKPGATTKPKPKKPPNVLD